MIKHFLKVTLRQMSRNGRVFAINIGGLAIGLACSMLILLYLKNELSYDEFHIRKAGIYQLACTRTESDGRSERFAIAAQVQGPAFKEQIPEIREYVRVFPQDRVIKLQDQLFNETLTWVDTAFFDVFSFPLISGDARSALTDLRSIVLSESAVRKYFGAAGAVGKQLLVDINGKFEPFVVSAVAKDPPANSTVRFSILLPFAYYRQVSPDNGWMWVSFPTYFLLSPGARVAGINQKMQQVYEAAAHEEIDLNTLAGYHNSFHWELLPMRGMHFRTEYKGNPEATDPVYAYILSGIAVFVLVIACINFVNLTVAQSLRRSREIGVRKVIGSSRSLLMFQFLGESMILCLLAFGLAIVLTVVALPAFCAMANKRLLLSGLVDVPLVLAAVVLVTTTGLFAGLYPAFVLSGFRPVTVLNGKTPSTGKNRLALALVVIQFALATVLVSSTLFVYLQFGLLTQTSTGYDDRDLLSFTVPEGIGSKPVMEYYRARLSAVPGVVAAGYQNIGRFGGRTVVNGKELEARYIRIDNGYPVVLGVPILRGRGFSGEFPADSVSSALVNETFVRQAGLADGVGKTIDFMNLPGWGARKLTITGILRDFHYASLKEPIEPMVFVQDNAIPLGKMLVRVRPTGVPGTLLKIDKAVHGINPNRPFVYEFAEEVNRRSYEPEHRWRQIIASGAAITVVVACTGLFGLSLLIVQKRRKEISVRKVIGASTRGLALLIVGDFGRLVVLAIGIAAPVSYLALHRWLEAYPYRVALSWWRFGIVGAGVLAIAVLTVGYHAVRAAAANPVNALKSE